MTNVATADATYLSEWVHPQLAAWADEDLAATQTEAAEDAEYEAFFEGIKHLERERANYHRKHETLPATERRPHEDKLADMDRNIRENYAYLGQRWPNYHPNARQRALDARKAQRAAKETPLRASLDALKDIDTKLAEWQRWSQTRSARKRELEMALAQVEAELALAGEEITACRLIWQEAADSVGFSGKPTIDLPSKFRLVPGDGGGLRQEVLVA